MWFRKRRSAMPDDEIGRLIAEERFQELRDFVSTQYRLLAPDMETAKGNVQKLVDLANAFQKPAKSHDGLRWEMHNLCHSIENIAGEMYEDAIRRYGELKQSAGDLEMARAEVTAMRRALAILSFAVGIAGAQNTYSRSNYRYWRDYTMNCEYAIASRRYYDA